MARVINDTCISCGTCAASCPVEAISQGDAQYLRLNYQLSFAVFRPKGEGTSAG